MSEKCKQMVWRGWTSSQCSRNATKDGWCKQHHPDSKKARRDASDARYKEKWENDPLSLSRKKVKELEATIEHQQFLIDNLMLEYCPDEMTKEQMDNWAKHQKVADSPPFIPTSATCCEKNMEDCNYPDCAKHQGDSNE